MPAGDAHAPRANTACRPFDVAGYVDGGCEEELGEEAEDHAGQNLDEAHDAEAEAQRSHDGRHSPDLEGHYDAHDVDDGCEGRGGETDQEEQRNGIISGGVLGGRASPG